MPMMRGNPTKENSSSGLKNALSVLTVRNTFKMKEPTTYTVIGFAPIAFLLMKER